MLQSPGNDSLLMFVMISKQYVQFTHTIDSYYVLPNGASLVLNIIVPQKRSPLLKYSVLFPDTLDDGMVPICSCCTSVYR